MKGQIHLFDNAKVEWKKYPACTKGFCSICGESVFYSPTSCIPCFADWEYEEKKCGKCGAKFVDDLPPKGLPLLSGLNDKPIVKVVNSIGYT